MLNVGNREGFHPYALDVQGLCKAYDTFSLKEVSFQLPIGYIMGLIGPNGAGKTTTIKAILNMIRVSSGSIHLFGSDHRDTGSKSDGQIGIVMDNPFYVGDWTVADVEKALSPFYRLWDADQYASLLRQFAIERTKKVNELSRGMKVKLMIAVALSHGAKLLILDEPTSGLDPVAREELCDLLETYVSQEGRSVLFSTHITADLEKIADYITFILDGQIVFAGTKEDLLAKYVVAKGSPDALSTDQKRDIIGYKESGVGFEGLVEAEQIGHLPDNVSVETATIDNIIVYMNKGARLHE